MTDNIIKTIEKEDKFFSKKTGMHLLGYSLVGGISNCCEIGILFLLVSVFHVWYLLGSAFVFTFGSIASFIGRRIFVFKKRGLYKIKPQILSYLFFYPQKYNSLICFGL